MNYNSYKSARDASWYFLIENAISELPVNIFPILKSLNITVWKDVTGNLSSGERRYSVFEDDFYKIVVL